MSSFRPWIIHFHRNLLGTLIYCYLLASSVTGIIDDSNFIRYPAYKKTAHDLNKASFLRSLRSVLGIDGTGYIEGFTYPLTSRSAAMISGRGFRPGKRYDAEIISFIFNLISKTIQRGKKGNSEVEQYEPHFLRSYIQLDRQLRGNQNGSSDEVKE